MLIVLLVFALGLLGSPVAAGQVPAGERFPAPYGYDAPVDALPHAPEGPGAQGALFQAPGSVNGATAPTVAVDGAATTPLVLIYTPRVAGAAGEIADDAAGIAFRSDTPHIFRDHAGHLLEDTPANRSLIRSAIGPDSLRSTITLPDGSTLAKYFRSVPDGTQVWAEVRNGVEITNGGLNAVPR